MRARSATPLHNNNAAAGGASARAGSAARASSRGGGGVPLLTKDQLYQQFSNEDVNRSSAVLCSRVPGFSIERQVSRDQRARSMCRIADRTFHSLTYQPKSDFADRHMPAVDLRRHCPRRFDQSAGFFTPISAHLAYQTEAPLRFLELHQHGHVEFGKLPAGVPEPDRVKAKLFEAGIARRKQQWLHPNDPCPIPKLSREQQTQAMPPQKLFSSVRRTNLEQSRTSNEVDATCGTWEVSSAAIRSKFVERNKGHDMKGDCTREARSRTGHYSGHEALLSRNLAPLRVRYDGLGGRGFGKYCEIGSTPKQQISFGRARKELSATPTAISKQERRVQAAAQSAPGATGDPIAAFNACRRSCIRNVRLGPGFRSATADDDDF